MNENSPVVKFARKFFSDGNMATLLSGGCPEGFDAEDKTVARQLKSLKFTAPIGLAMASERIDATASMSLADGLQLELQGLDRIFSTEDALEGLSALIEGRRATYKNA
jgi:enoyl-CoA hydratase/3-hydroxyacyl-CoA dehydrogenase